MSWGSSWELVDPYDFRRESTGGRIDGHELQREKLAFLERLVAVYANATHAEINRVAMGHHGHSCRAAKNRDLESPELPAFRVVAAHFVPSRDRRYASVCGAPLDSEVESANVSSSLVVGDWVVAKSEHGLLEIEYALFDASEVLLVADAPGLGSREQGYLTTAGFARGRLDAAGVNAETARAALEALGPLRDLVRARAIAPLVDQLGPCEAFEGSVYDAPTRRYRGAWLDLDAVAGKCPLPDASLAMQLLHLVLVMEEVAQDAPVRLLVDAEANAPAGARTWKRVQVGSVKHLPRSLATTEKPIIARVPSDEANVCDELARDLRARAAASHVERPRLHALASALLRRETSSAQPTANAQPIDSPEVIITDDVDYEPVPLLDELRGHTDMLHGEWHLREVAQFLTAMADRRTHVSELAILAARAWLASGETGYARYFARRVTEDRAALSGSRVAAQEILESTTPTNESMRPPPATSVKPSPIVIISDAPIAAAPPGASLPPMAPARSASDQPIPSAPRAPRIDAASTQPIAPAKRVEVAAPVAPAPVVAPPKVIAANKPSGPEVVETMSTPDGDVRIRMTQLARELARDYRLSYGTTLKTDPIAIEAMQRHLRRRFNDAKADERVAQKLEAELTRHGALLSEILVRALGAEWTDTTDGEPGRWAMTVPPSTRVWPIGRVYRYFQQGHRESDLLAFYFELEKSARAR